MGVTFTRARDVFRLTRPGPERVAAFPAAQRGAPLSYPEAGATRGPAPPGYTVDHNRARLGSGPDAFDEDDAAAGVRRAGFAHGTLPAHGEIGEERFAAGPKRAMAAAVAGRAPEPGR